MRFLARQISTAAPKKGLSSERTPHGALVAVLSGHALLQQFTE
jgi:hypothetical protein